MLSQKTPLALPILFLRLLIPLALALSIGHANSHDSRPIYVEINEQESDVYSVQWKAPLSLPLFALPSLHMPKHCLIQGQQSSRQYGDAYTMQQRYHCPSGLAGQGLTLYYPNNNPSLSTLFRIKLLNGERHTSILDPSEKHWQIPVRVNRWQVAKQYTVLGLQHIFSGIDHLLFVACLVFIAASFRRLLITITGFTLAHTLTLALSALNIVRLPIAAVEATIALSIVFLAYEITLNNKNSWTWRYPILVSSSFGLLHGFGFASALKDIGLPQTELNAALIAFNFGVELGQLIFITGLTALSLALRQYWTRLFKQISGRKIISYGIGATASYWLIERLVFV